MANVQNLLKIISNMYLTLSTKYLIIQLNIWAVPAAFALRRAVERGETGFAASQGIP